MEVNKLIHWPCKQENCFKPAVYEFTDAKSIEVNISDENGTSASSVETIILGHSCEHHVEEVNKMLKEIHNGN